MDDLCGAGAFSYLSLIELAKSELLDNRAERKRRGEARRGRARAWTTGQGVGLQTVRCCDGERVMVMG